MPTRRERRPNKPLIFRITFFIFAWVFYCLLLLSFLSFAASDVNCNSITLHRLPHYHNWCSSFGAHAAYWGMSRIGPGAYLALIFVGVGLFLWTSGRKISQFPLRLIGVALLIASFSTFFNLAGLCDYLGEGAGGSFGYAIGTFCSAKFGVGAWFLVPAVFVVGAMLAVDEFVLALPAMLMHIGRKTEPVAAVAGGAAGGLWASVCAWVDSLGTGNKQRMGRRRSAPSSPSVTDSEAAVESTEPKINAARKKRDAAAAEAIACENSAAAVALNDGIPEGIELPEDESAARALVEKIKAKDKAAAESAVSVGDTRTQEPEDVPVRKPPVPKGPTLPFRPAPPPQKAQDLGNYRLPGLDLLDEPESIDAIGQEQRVREKAKILEATLLSFNIDGKVEAIDTGPVVTLYELSLAPGVKSSQVAALAKDIARALKSPPVRIIDNIPGKSTMGIEVPNLDRERVRLKDLFQIGHDNITRMALPMCLGKDASGNPLIEDLAKIPHVLIAGTTGSGKSVCINSIILTLLLTQRPDHVKLIMVDPKMVEMQDYKTIPHLMAPIIDDMSKAESILEWATQKMDERYETFSEAGVRHIKDYNKLTREEIIERFQATTDDDKAKLVFHMPYLVIIIDELADLMMTSKEVEGHIVRIAQKARAVGIHLILATQRPEAQVVTGLIKSNMPGRICFQVRSRLDSRIMLDQSGGELLLGQGDMLMLRPTGAGLVRAQGAFVDDKEIKRIATFLKEIAEPEFHPELMQLGTASGLTEGEEKDPLYNEAVEIMIESGRGSVSLISRRLNIGYSRASRLIDQMRRLGIVGAYKGSQASDVLITKEEWEIMKAEESATGVHTIPGGDGSEGSTGGKSGIGDNAGFAQQVSSNYTESENDNTDVPDEFPGEHRM